MDTVEFSHRVFRLDSPLGQIAYVPTLREAFLVPSEEMIPDFVLSEIPTPESLAPPSSRSYPTHATLALTEDCNKRCWYCFIEAGKQKKRLDLDAGKAVIAQIAEHANQQSHKTFVLHFFGGEPTMAWPQLLALDKYAKEVAAPKGLTYLCSISTNGIMSRAKIDWLIANITTKITLSLDGPEDIHNTHRPMPNGAGSWVQAMDFAQRVYQAIPDQLTFRATVSDFSVNRLPEIARFMGLNFPQTPQAYEPMSGKGREGSPICEPDPMLFVQRFFEGYDWALDHELIMRTSILRLGLVGLTFCGACGHSLTITPNGNLSSCQRMTSGKYGPSSMVYGHWDPVEKELVIDEEILRDMKQIKVSNFEACTDCFARYSCRGDCLALKAARGIDYKSVESFRCDAIRWLLAQVIQRSLRKNLEAKV